MEMKGGKGIALISLLGLAVVFSVIKIFGDSGGPGEGLDAGKGRVAERQESTARPVGRSITGLKDLTGPDSERVIRTMDKEACLAAIQSGVFAGGKDGLLEKLLARLAILDPIEAVRVGMSMDPVPDIKIWLSDTQIERIISKHEQDITRWLGSYKESTKADAAMKVRFLTGITLANPSAALNIYAQRKQRFNEDDMGRVPIALAMVLSKNPKDAFDACLTNYEDKSVQGRYLKSMLQVGVPGDFEQEIEGLVASLPDDEVRKAAMQGLVYGYERRGSDKAEGWKKKLAEQFDE